MHLIVGLGNPGQKYARTRHNLGFMVLDQLAKEWGVEWETNKKVKGEVSSFKFQVSSSSRGEKIYLLKPQGYMNNSGEAVRNFIKFYKLETRNSKLETYIIHDDLDLDLGRLKIQHGGGTAGHHGVESVYDAVSSFQFPISKLIRFRMGISNSQLETNNPKLETSDYVLTKFAPAEQPAVAQMVYNCTQALETAVIQGVSAAMNKFN
jgi:PTH1 family peptidyl-tRNA hydrolase